MSQTIKAARPGTRGLIVVGGSKRPTSTEPVSTRFPDDAWLGPTCCSVTVSVGKSIGEMA